VEITYGVLLNQLSKLSKEQLDMTVTVYDAERDEFFPVTSYDLTGKETDVLDRNHPVLSIFP
jgi:hypothetical protein